MGLEGTKLAHPSPGKPRPKPRPTLTQPSAGILLRHHQEHMCRYAILSQVQYMSQDAPHAQQSASRA